LDEENYIKVDANFEIVYFYVRAKVLEA